MIRRSSLIALEVIAGLVAAVLIGLGAAWWRLSQGPVELNSIRQQVQYELSRARSGRPVGIEKVELAWTKEGNALELRAVGVTVEDGRGHVLSRSDEARIELNVLPLLIGHISLVRADFSGGDLTVTHRADGALYIAFGPPGAPPDIIIPPSQLHESLAQRVNRLLDGMEAAFQPVGPGGRLRSLRVSGAHLAIIDEAGGGRWTADSATLELAREGDALAFVANARLEGANGLAPASLRITTDTQFQSAIIEFGAHDVRPRALFSPAVLGPFAGLDAPLTATISLGLDRRTGVSRLEGDATLGRGVADMAGGRFDLSGGRLHGRYDLDGDELIIDQLNLAGQHTRVRGEVHVRQASAILRADPNKPAPFDIALPSATLDVPGVLSAPIDFSDVQIVGAIDSGNRSINFTRAHARTGDAIIDTSGRLYWGEAGGHTYPGLQLDGAVAGVLSMDQVMSLWPMSLAESARHYLVDSHITGRISNLKAQLDIRPSDLAAGVLRNEAINLTFDMNNGEMRFVPTMSPVVGARGHGVLQGNRFDLAVQEARLNNLVLTRGSLEVPRLKPHGALMTLAAHAEGDARNLVEILDQKPLDLRDRLPVDASTVTGRAAVNVRLQRPLLDHVEFRDWLFAVDGRLDNFAGNMSTRRVALSQGRLDVRGDQRAIVVAGPVRAGSSDVNVSWTEHLDRPGRASSEYQFSGDFDADDLVRLGYPIAAYGQGRIGVQVSGQGRGFDVDQANIQLDLRNAAVDSPFHFWTKRAGQIASMSFDIARQQDASLQLNNFEARGVGMLAQGRIRITHEGRIIEADLPRFALDGRSDARLHAQRARDGALEIDVRGPLFDGAPFMDSDDESNGASGGAQEGEPFVRAAINVDRLKLRGGATLSNARVQLATRQNSLDMLMADGKTPQGKSFTLALGVRPDDPQGRIRMEAEDAGFAMRALTGAENIQGGIASADGVWRTGPPSRADFVVHLRDFQIVRLPAMARLLSSAGSLTGLAEMLNGDGIGFTALDAPMSFANNRLQIGEARAAGPSLGLTGTGAYDMHGDNLNINGVVVPSFGVNSMLGALPLVGDLLVSRRGEGVVGITYSINGPVTEPRVGVNPLSALTPGILRRIFEPVTPRARNATQSAQRTTTPAAPPPAAPAPAPTN
ncbi:MAG TPA: AsmA-like C-terminal region-containing protein [Caulobacterales bacterium]|nr:AsmA-like C-terminal region-containing protein [Caulobacterales bacterium]